MSQVKTGNEIEYLKCQRLKWRFLFVTGNVVANVTGLQDGSFRPLLAKPEKTPRFYVFPFFNYVIQIRNGHAIDSNCF